METGLDLGMKEATAVGRMGVESNEDSNDGEDKADSLLGKKPGRGGMRKAEVERCRSDCISLMQKEGGGGRCRW